MTPQQLARVLRAGEAQAEDPEICRVLVAMAIECDQIAEEDDPRVAWGHAQSTMDEWDPAAGQ